MSSQDYFDPRTLTPEEIMAVSGGMMKQVTAVSPGRSSPGTTWVTIGDLPPNEGVGIVVYPP